MVLGCRLLVPNPEKKKGRFNLGRWSVPVNLIGFLWALFAMFAFILPTSWPITSKFFFFFSRKHHNNLFFNFLGDTFNYAGVGLIVVIMTTVIFWMGWGRYHYEGPKAMSDEIGE